MRVYSGIVDTKPGMVVGLWRCVYRMTTGLKSRSLSGGPVGMLNCALNLASWPICVAYACSVLLVSR